MFRFLLLTAILAIAPIVCAAEQTEKNQPDELTQRIWKEIQGKPNPRIMDNFEVLEGFPLLVKGPGISSAATILNAVLEFQFGGFENVNISFKESYKRAKAQTRKNDQEIYEGLTALRPKGQYEKEKVAYEKMRVIKKQTETVKYSCFFQVYLNDAGSIEGAVSNLRKNYYLVSTLEAEDKVTWGKLKEAIDKKIPAILGEGDDMTVAVGYYIAGNTKYVLVYTPEEAEYRIVSGVVLLSEEARKVDSPFVRGLRKQKLLRDNSLILKESIPPGILARPMQDIDGVPCLLIYDWKPDIEQLFSLLLKRLNVPVKQENQE